MVSTRGIKHKFLEGERVLCYEPDPTKAKVLYDSKVLEVNVAQHQRGKRSTEYLIHFQGWNSSWDRNVKEEYVLKDTPENRQLQKDLAEKSQLQLGAYLYRKERKKHNRKTSERQTASSEDGSSGSPTRMDIDEAPPSVVTSSSEDDSSLEEETIQIELPQELRDILEHDFYSINERNKLLKLPSDPTVVSILESYYKHYATNQICGLQEKPNSRYRQIPNNQPKPKPEDIQKNLTICREILDGLRVYFDFTLNHLLLYKPENEQIVTKPAIFEPLAVHIKVEIKQEYDDSHDYANENSSVGEDDNQNGYENQISSRRRTLRSSRSDSQTNGNFVIPDLNATNNTPKAGGSSVSSSNSDTTLPMTKTLMWKLLPEQVFNQHPPPPCLVYGATHLTRLLVKLPELLTASNIGENKLKLLLSHLELFIDYLNEHKEWFGDKVYMDAF